MAAVGERRLMYKSFAVRWLIPLITLSLYYVSSHQLMFLKQNIRAYNIYVMPAIIGVDYSIYGTVLAKFD